MPGPGETPVKKTIGGIVSEQELDILMMRNQSQAKPFCDLTVMPSGNKYTFAFLERCGIAVYSHQDSRVFVLEMREMIDLAKAAGLDKEHTLIIVPPGAEEVNRG